MPIIFSGGLVIKITETHKQFPCGGKGRVSIFADDGSLIDAIITPVQKARRYCEANTQTAEGRRFNAAVYKAAGVPEPASTVRQDPTPLADAGYSAIPRTATSVASGGAFVDVPPVLTGKNPANTALVSAQKKLARLHELGVAIGLGLKPKSELEVVHTARGNTYLNACDDYKATLLAGLVNCL